MSEYTGALKNGAKVSRLFTAMLRTLLTYLVVIIVFVIAIGFTLHLAAFNFQSDPDFSNPGVSILRTYRALMGETLDWNQLIAADAGQTTSILAPALYFVFTVIGLLLLLNLLIALMTTAFEQVTQTIDTDFYIVRGELISRKVPVYITSRFVEIYPFIP